jgi:transposase
LRFILTGGEAHDVTTAADLLDGQTAGGIIADKAYDTNALREMIEDAEIEVVIPSKRNRKIQIPHDAQAYKPSSSTFAGSPRDMTAGRFTS